MISFFIILKIYQEQNFKICFEKTLLKSYLKKNHQYQKKTIQTITRNKNNIFQTFVNFQLE